MSANLVAIVGFLSLFALMLLRVPVTPTRPIAMPTGMRSSISANRLRKPMMATAFALIIPPA